MAKNITQIRSMFAQLVLLTFSPLVLGANLGTEECKGIHNSYECAQKIERVQIAKYGNLITRNQDSLRLILASGKALTLNNKDDKRFQPNEVVSYTFRDYVKQADYFLIDNQYYEGASYSLINRKTGKVFIVDDTPVFSPTFDRLITVSICDAHCPYRLQIWRLTESGIQLEWTHKPSQYWASGSAKWLDHTTIEVVREIADPVASVPSKGKYVWAKKPVYLKLLPDGWRLSE